MKGILNVLKPVGMTSHDVVNHIRKTYRLDKVGHTGTLDPGASGVLPICIGKATRVSSYVMDSTKTYRAEMTFGTATDSGDSYGNILETSEERPDKETFLSVLDRFIGEIEQVPPMTSAVKVGGQTLYKLARKGQEIERPKRKVTIYGISLVRFTKEKAVIDVTCSSGTYIRTLIADIGKECGTAAYMSFLIRTRVNCFCIEDAWPLEMLKEKANLEDCLCPIEQVFRDLEQITLTKTEIRRLLNGLAMPLKTKQKKDTLLLLFDQKREAVALGKTISSDSYKIFKNLSEVAETGRYESDS